MSANLATILTDTAEKHGDKTAFKLDDVELSYSMLDEGSARVAGLLKAKGLEEGDRVGLMMPNVPYFPVIYFGILRAGGIVVPMNVLLKGREVEFYLSDPGAKILFAWGDFAEAAEAGAEKAGAETILVKPGEFEKLLADQEPEKKVAERSEEDTAVILYTSGTTGKPKGAELTHSNLFVNCAVVVPKLVPPAADDVALGVLPLFHSFGQTCIQNATLATGGTFSLLPRFAPEDAFDTMERHRVTLFAGVPTMYFALLHHPASRAYDLSRLRWCMSGGAPMPVEVMKAFEQKFGVEVLEGFGLSETSPVASFNTKDRPRKPGSIGYPVWGVEMAILDDHDRPLPDGERGEICIRGHNVMKGYLGRPDATKEAMRGGWFHSGDIGIRDADGSYRIVDRKKDMILRGGFNVYPREVEEVLYAHPAIVEAAVVGVPHESHGEEVKAVVVSRDPTLSRDALVAWCKERLAAYKYPRLVEFVESLPKGPTGKILKRELRR
jgi:long-chain acyl-CoA synthetase